MYVHLIIGAHPQVPARTPNVSHHMLHQDAIQAIQMANPPRVSAMLIGNQFTSKMSASSQNNLDNASA